MMQEQDWTAIFLAFLNYGTFSCHAESWYSCDLPAYVF